MFKLRVFLTVCCILIADTCLSQKASIPANSPEIKKNAVSVTAGFGPQEFYFSLLGNYERMIYQLPKSFVHSFWIRVGAGPWAGWGPTGVNYVSTLSALMGRGGAHLEFGSGVLFTYWSDTNEFKPIVNDRHIAGFLGFRYQKPGGSFVFRTGVGWPEGIYLSLGYCF
jgi:hypothetical protein